MKTRRTLTLDSRVLLSILTAAVWWSSALPVVAQQADEVSESPSTAEPQRGPLDPVEVEAFLDGLMAAHLEDHNIAGATVAVVRDGRLLFASGYGYADREERQPVDPERTLFRIGSVSKLFTWTAVMQQVEAGKLDLDTDVNEYIDFEIPATYAEPITLTHLLTHTPGFEDRALGLFGTTELSRAEYLERHLPARVRPPGTFSAYSNFGTSLAGHIVEQVSGMSWEEYIDQHILEPLGMEFATGRQPLPERLAPYMSKGYAEENGELVAKDFEMIEGSAPAGSVSASAGAMAKFMIAHLQYGRYGEQRILEEETARQMYGRLFAHDDRLPGVAHGFYEQTSHGLRLIGHGGDTGWFHTDLALAHDEGFGIFVSYNTASGGQLSFRPFLELFLDHYYPEEARDFEEELTAAELERYTGTYRLNRTSYTTFEKSFGLLSSVEIEAAENGRLRVTSPLGKVLFAPVEQDLFHEVEGTDLLSFREDESGRVTHAFLGSLPFMAMERLGPLEAPGFHRALLVVVLVLFSITLIALPVRAVLRRRFSEMHADSRQERRARWLAWLTAVAGLVFAGALTAVVSNPMNFIEGNVGSLRIVLGLGVVTALLTLGVVVYAVLVWKDRYWTVWGRLRYSLFALAAAAFVLVLNYWNLLGWKIR